MTHDPGKHGEPRLLDRVRIAIRTRHYSPRTEEAYVRWITKFILYHGKKHPADMGRAEVARYVSALATERQVSASTQNQALAAIIFLYREVLGMDMPWLDEITRAKKPPRLPVVLTREEVAALLSELSGTPYLMATLMYGAGLRVMECARLRIKDVDLASFEIRVRSGKGGRDRITLVPREIEPALRRQVQRVRELHERDLGSGRGWVELPFALERKYPHAGRELAWQWLFPAARPYWHAASGQHRRHHLHETVVQRAVKQAARAAGIPKVVSCHALRHSFRHSPPGGWLRHPHGAGTPGPP